MTQTDEVSTAPFEVEDESGTTDRRRLALIGVVAAVVLAAGGWFLIGGGGGETEDLGPVASGRHVVKPVAKQPAAAKPVAVLPAASTVRLGRDPFRPLYVVPAAPVAGAPAAPGTATGGTGTTGTGTTVTPTKAPAAKPSTYALRLSRIDGTGSKLTARFLLGSTQKIQYARAGSVFGLRAEIRLLSLQKGPNGTGTAVIQVGDGSPFDISTSDAAIYVQ